MTELTPIYTPENCSFSCPLQWGLSVFWREAVQQDPWFSDLAAALEPDGIRLLGHRFDQPGVSQFSISSQSHVPPELIVQRVKGRLQYLVRDRMPKPWKRNYAIRSVGSVTRDVVEQYVASQLGHHSMADASVQERFRRYQIVCHDVDLSQPRRTSHGVFWYNLQLVLVHRERWIEVREGVLSRIQEMIRQASAAKGYLLSRAGILADHVHLVLGCPLDVAPEDVAIGFLNNLAYEHGMAPVFQFGGFLGTVGEYTNRALKSETSLRGGKPRGGDDELDDGASDYEHGSTGASPVVAAAKHGDAR